MAGTLPLAAWARATVERAVDVLAQSPSLGAGWGIARRGIGAAVAAYLAWVGFSLARHGWAPARHPPARPQEDSGSRARARPPTDSRASADGGRRGAVVDQALALACLPIVHVVLQLLGPGPTRRVLRLLPSGRGAAPPPAAAVRAVERAARLLRIGNCLSRSLTTQAMLRRHGMASDLRIGVHRDGTRFAAHAWLEHEGAVLNDQPAVVDRFAAFDEVFGLGRLRWQARRR